MRYAHQRAVTGRLRRLRSLAQEEFVHARARANGGVKVTLPSPPMMQTFWSPEHSTAAYGDPFEMFADAAAIVREEIADLAALGAKRTELEEPDALLRRIEEAARLYPRDRLAVSPRCGFESAIGDYPLNEEQQQRKLRLVVEGAERAWAA